MSTSLSLPVKQENLSLVSLSKRIFVLNLASMLLSLYSSIIFNLWLARKKLSRRHTKSKHSYVQNNDALILLLSTRDIGRFMVLAALSPIVCKMANLKYKGLLSAAIVDALDTL